ncbi:MAG: GNAT family N-acetyltransferase, partial [Paracoccaceae bacterium]
MNVDFQIPEIETERLRMRLPKLSDLPTLIEFRASQRIVGGPFAPETGFDYLGAIIGQWHLRGYGRWIVTEKSNDAPLGLVGIYHPDDWPEAEIGWMMF